MRNAAKIDANQPEIVSGLRKAGYSVYVLGLPLDLLVGWGGTKCALIECKIPGKRNNLTEFQRNFIPAWRGPIGIATTLDEAIAFLESI